ncbi:MAG TPA: hypothetical protein VFN21_02710 [Acidimicrobiales bacterium]|nr:hypothetical protein [Acidimicrobiales bacterium]
MTRSRLRGVAALLTVALVASTACGSSGDASSGERAVGSSASTATTGDPAAQAPLDELRIHHPETLAFAAPFSLIADDGPLSKVADDIVDNTWSTPDELRGLLTSGRSDVTAVPTYVGANLANKGVDVKMAAVTVWGLLYVIGPDGVAQDWDALRGQTVMMPFPNDMPDLVFRTAAAANGLVPGKDFEIENYATPQEAVMRLVTGKGKWAVLPEHVATVALAKAGEQGHDLQRVLNLQDEWAEISGGSERIPQAGIVVSAEIAARPDVLAALFDELESTVATVNAADAATVAELADTFDLPESVVAAVIPRLNLDVVPAAEARDELETFFEALAENNPDIIGGKLPPAGFYLADPRS